MPITGGLTADANFRSSTISATVVRCGCGDPQSHIGAVCPRPRKTEKLGAIAFFHRNPLINAVGNLWIKVKDLARGAR